MTLGQTIRSLYVNYSRLTWTVYPCRQLYGKCNMSWKQLKPCISNCYVNPVWCWLRSPSPQVNNQDYFAMSQNCKRQQKPTVCILWPWWYDFYCNVQKHIYVFLPGTLIPCPWFSMCGFLFYLLMSLRLPGHSCLSLKYLLFFTVLTRLNIQFIAIQCFPVRPKQSILISFSI